MKFFRTLILTASFATALAASACQTQPPTPGEPHAFADICEHANDGHRVSVEGYLRLPDTIEVIKPARGGSESKLVVVRLFQNAKFQGTPIGVDIDFGSGPNTMQEIPGEYIFTDDDLKVHLATGETATYGDRVKVSGTMYFPTALADDSVDFPCGLSNPLLEQPAKAA